MIPTGLRRLLLVVASISLGASSVSAQESTATLLVTVLDSASSEPVRGARVEVAGVRWVARTGADGVARLTRLPSGNRLVTISRLGYEPRQAAVALAAGGSTERVVSLVVAPIETEGVTASVHAHEPGVGMQGFYERQRRGFGRFMSADQIDFIRPTRTIDLFRRLSGFTVTFDRRGKPQLLNGRGDCGKPPIVFLDGMLVTSALVNAAEALSYIPPEDIAGLEAYPGPSVIPPQYNPTGSACGVVLVWTRVGSRL